MKVYLNDAIAPSAYERLKKHVEIVTDFEHPEELDAIIVRQQPCGREVISRAVKCRLIQQHGTGLDRIDTAAAREFGIPVGNTPGVNAQSAAEYTILLLLAAARKAAVIDRKTRAGQLSAFGLPETVGIELRGKRLGLIGFGHIAAIVAETAKCGFHMEAACCSAHLSRREIMEKGLLPASSPEELFETCDFVSLHGLLTPQTRHMVGRELLRHARPGLILVNTARGGLVDEAALCEALRDGRLAAAGLDVFEKEPPDTDNPLLAMDNVVCGMHVAGSTRDALERNGKAVVDRVFQALGIDG